MADSNGLPNGIPPNDKVPEPQPLSSLDQILENARKSLGQLGSLAKAIRAPVPTETGDGSELPQPKKENIGVDLKEIARDLAGIGFTNLKDVAEVVAKASVNEPLDDKKYLMEHTVQAAVVEPDDIFSETITKQFITTLWNDLQHPPQTLLTDKYSYRQPDGSSNNYQLPHIGAAGMPYARSVEPQTMRDGALPDPGVLFDTTMARKKQEGTPHPNKISSMLFYLASIIIHDVFKTNRNDYNVSDTSSYLDLAPLYGSNWKDQKSVRTMKDGKLKPDCFAETRLLMFPPGVGALLIMFNRYHNYIVENLAAINEDGRFTESGKKVKRYRDDADSPLEEIDKRDDDLFQTGRLITCGLYVNIILIDYVRTILNLNRTDSDWQLNPRLDIHNGPPRGTGNQVSCEFNLVYRWHAAISNKDDLWTQELFKENFPDIDPSKVDDPKVMMRFLGDLGRIEQEQLSQAPQDRPWPGLKSDQANLVRIRDKTSPYDGNLPDDGLAKILTEGIEDCANAAGPQQVPVIMKAIEMLGIMQARTWRTATLNEFRRHFSLKPHEKFSDITKNEEVAETLKNLYDTPDNVELYPGLVVEDAKEPKRPGSGLCPGFTVSRGVLSDATALVRGDRFYTTSFTPAALTNWGYQEVNSDLDIDNGCVFYKLFLRGLPNNFDPASVYAHYPLTIPQGQDGMKEVLSLLGKADKYNFDRPEPIKQPTVLFSYDACKKILDDQENFHVTWGPAMEFLMGKPAASFMLAGDKPANADSRTLMEDALYLGGSSRLPPTGQEKWLIAVRDYYADVTTTLLAEKTYKVGKMNEVDIIRSIGNYTHLHFASELFSIPLKTASFPHGVFTEGQLYLITAAVFIAVFFDVDPPKSFPLRQKAREATKQLGDLLQAEVQALKTTGWVGEKVAGLVRDTAKPLREYGVHMITQLLKKTDGSVEDLVWGNLIPTLGGAVAPQGQVFGQVMEWFLLPENKEHLDAATGLAKQDTPEADEKLLKYLMEAIRLNAESAVFRWVQADTALTDTTALLGARRLDFKKGDKIMLNFRSASRDPTHFGPDPNALNFDHPLDSYINFGGGAHQCLGLPMTRVALVTMLKTVLVKCPNLRPAKVTAGGSLGGASRVKKVAKEFVPGSLNVMPENWHYHAYFTESWDQELPFPQSLKVNYD